jgi:hypothetical protein
MPKFIIEVNEEDFVAKQDAPVWAHLEFALEDVGFSSARVVPVGAFQVGSLIVGIAKDKRMDDETHAKAMEAFEKLHKRIKENRIENRT